MVIEKIDILAFGAHPDDVELGAGATLAQLSKKKKKIVIVDLTEGELGTRGDVPIRYAESKKASKILRIHRRVNLKMFDGFFQYSRENILKIVHCIRKYQPEIIFANPPKDRHPDHGRASKLVTDAFFLSGLSKIKTFHEKEKQKEWKPKNLYYYILWDILKPDFIVDISGFETKKMQACMAYSTQFFSENSTEKQTLISSKNFHESILYRMRDLGRIIGVDYGEGFIGRRMIAVKNIFDLC